jgi:hypothetical protein
MPKASPELGGPERDGGCGRLDVAVNNACTEGKVGPITDQTAES